MNPAWIVAELQPMSVFVRRAMAATEFVLFLVSVFAVIAVVLAAVGLYGVLSTTVRQRTAEIGVRVAFGAQTRTIFQLILAQGLRLSAIGLVAGLAGAVAITRVMESMLVGVTATDPTTFISIAGLFFACTTLACCVPALRAARLDPVTALREE